MQNKLPLDPKVSLLLILTPLKSLFHSKQILGSSLLQEIRLLKEMVQTEQSLVFLHQHQHHSSVNI